MGEKFVLCLRAAWVWCVCLHVVLSVSTENDNSEGPNVETALSMSPTTAMTTAESHKPTIGTRKQAPAKKGVKN